MYYDYNYKKGKARQRQLAWPHIFPMWAGMVDKSDRPKRSSKPCAASKTKAAWPPPTPYRWASSYSVRMPTQWAYPNGWAPLHYIVIKALERYGYHKDARRIATKWLKTNLALVQRARRLPGEIQCRQPRQTTGQRRLPVARPASAGPTPSSNASAKTTSTSRNSHSLDKITPYL